MTEIKKILMSPGDFRDYREKLNFVSGHVIPHEGEPARYPALAITDFCDDQLKRPCWRHAFIYSSLEDLCGIAEKVEHESLLKIAADQANRPVVEEKKPTEQDEWDKFWDDVEKVSPSENVPLSDVEKQEEDDFLVVRDTVGKRVDQDIFFACNWFFKRWPSSKFKSTILKWLDLVDMKKVVPERSDKTPDPVYVQKQLPESTHRLTYSREVRFAERD